MTTPSQPRTTRPCAMSWRMTSLAWLIGIENPMPCPEATIAVLMPMTRPSRPRSGPPRCAGWAPLEVALVDLLAEELAEPLGRLAVRPGGRALGDGADVHDRGRHLVGDRGEGVLQGVEERGRRGGGLGRGGSRP